MLHKEARVKDCFNRWFKSTEVKEGNSSDIGCVMRRFFRLSTIREPFLITDGESRRQKGEFLNLAPILVINLRVYFVEGHIEGCYTRILKGSNIVFRKYK